MITNKTSTCYHYYCTSKTTIQGVVNGENGDISATNDTLTALTNGHLNGDSSSARKRPSTDFIDIEDNKQKIFHPSKSPVKPLNGTTTNGTHVSHSNGVVNHEDHDE